MKYRIIRILFIIFLCGGCAELRVKVDVLNPEIVIGKENQDLVVDKMRQISAEDSQSISVMFTDIQNAHYTAYLAAANNLRNKAKNEKNKTKKNLMIKSADDIEKGFSQTVTPIYLDTEKKWLTSITNMQNLYKEYAEQTDEKKQNQLLEKLVIAIKHQEGIEKNLQYFRVHDLGDQLLKTDSYFNEVDNQKALKTAKLIQNNLFDSGDFINSKYVFHVVNAPDEFWGQSFDESYGSGFMGNVDIAIKAIAPGNYTVKGLSFNPSDVANMASKVSTQSILLAAQIAGVPVNIKGTPTGTGAALATSSTRLSTAKKNQANLEAKINSQKDALLKIAQAIIDEKDNIEGTNNERVSAINGIKAVYDSQASRVTISGNKEGD